MLVVFRDKLRPLVTDFQKSNSAINGKTNCQTLFLVYLMMFC